MNRFEYAEAKLQPNETFVSKDRNIKLYDGDEKTQFEDGELVLSTHRLFWGRPGEIARGMRTLCLQLQLVVSLDEEVASSFIFGKKKRIIVHLKSLPEENKQTNFIKLSGKNGMDPDFVKSLNETIAAKVWAVTDTEEDGNEEKLPPIKLRSGIMGIERGLQEKQKQTDDNISIAFQDLTKLMIMAKDMVGISKSISTKIRERQGEISDDETVRFKSYLMSLGIDDPVTRGTSKSDSEYVVKLAMQVCDMLLETIIESGGMMSMADAYCRVNRARGLELLSPEDLLHACLMLDGPIKLRQFPSGAMVLELETHDENVVAEATFELIEASDSVSVEELAASLNISFILAKERLLTCERAGLCCRDESMEGLRFYPNMFLKAVL